MHCSTSKISNLSKGNVPINTSKVPKGNFTGNLTNFAWKAELAKRLIYSSWNCCASARNLKSGELKADKGVDDKEYFF